MLSAYLITAATSSPPSARSQTTDQTVGVKPTKGPEAARAALSSPKRTKRACSQRAAVTPGRLSVSERALGRRGGEGGLRDAEDGELHVAHPQRRLARLHLLLEVDVRKA